eukprot:5222126-Pleurochrysis_carterae.AAC.1
MSISADDVPLPLEATRPYLQRAQELRSAHPLASHALRMLAMRLALKMRSSLRTADMPLCGRPVVSGGLVVAKACGGQMFAAYTRTTMQSLQTSPPA